MRHIAFLPDRIPDIVDNFDRVERIYFGAEPPSGNESKDYLHDLYEICTVGPPSKKLPARLPYRFCVYMVQLETLFGPEKVTSKSVEYISKLAGKKSLTQGELDDLRERLSMAKNWVASYAPQSLKFQISIEAPSYRPKTEAERSFISAVIALLENDLPEGDLQNEIFNTARSLGMEIGEAFSVMYRILLGSERGPRLAPLLMALDRDWLLRRMRSVL
jgi:lysyl-tRNA synthetase class 1